MIFHYVAVALANETVKLELAVMYIFIVILSRNLSLYYYNRGNFYEIGFFSFEQRLIVCLEESLYIHNIRDMKVLHTIRDTPPNPHGLCALSINNDNCFLAYPGSNQIGEVQIFDTINLVRFYYLLGYLHSDTVNSETSALCIYKKK